MTGYLTIDANHARLDELRRRADRHRATRTGGTPVRAATQACADAPIAIRRATGEDRAALERLAALDSSVAPAGEVLIAHVGSEPQAAIEIATGVTIADPFRPTAHLVELLEVRAAHLRARARAPRRRLRLRPRSAYRAA